jgi:hypothetical protein
MIYFLRAMGGDMVKIGFTENDVTLKSRIASLQTGVPWKLELLRLIREGGREMETWFHKQFSWAHSNGEWFVYTPMMLSAYPPQPEFDTRLRSNARARECLAEIVEGLIDLMDLLTPDVERETELADCEPEAEMYFRTTDVKESVRVTWDDCDRESSEVDVIAADDGCDITFPLVIPREVKLMMEWWGKINDPKEWPNQEAPDDSAT